MSSTRSALMDGNERSVVSGVNEMDFTTSCKYDDSLDRNSSCSSVRMDYQRLMNDHERRAAILEEYRLLVEHRKAQEKQHQEEEQEKEKEEEKEKETERKSSLQKEREKQKEHSLPHEDDKNIQPRSNSSRIAGDSALSERRSVNERRGTLDSKLSKNSSSPNTIVIPIANTNTTNTDTTNDTTNTTNTISHTTTTPSPTNSTTTRDTTHTVISGNHSNHSNSNISIRRGKTSCTWTRPRNALTSTTASSAAKQKPKVNSAPNTPRQNDQNIRQRGRTVTTRLSPKNTTAVSSMNPSFWPSRASRNTQLSASCEPAEPISAAASQISSSSRKEPFSDSRRHINITSTQETMNVAESPVVPINTINATNTTTTNNTNTTTIITTPPAAAAGGNSNSNMATEGRKTTTSRLSLSLNCSISSSEQGAAVVVPNSQNATTMEIETEEDKEYQQHQKLEYNKAQTTPFSVHTLRSVSASTTPENTQFASQVQQERYEEEHHHQQQQMRNPSSPYLTESLLHAGEYREEASLMTTGTGITTEVTSPRLWRFDVQRKEDKVVNNNNNNNNNITNNDYYDYYNNNNKKNMDGNIYDISLGHRESNSREKKSQSCSQDTTASHSHSRNINSEGRTTSPKVIMHIITPTIPTRDEHPRRAIGNSAAGPISTIGTADNDDRAACISTVAAVLQGILVQRRRVFPCYYCGESQQLSAYRLHLDICRTHTEALYARYGLNPLRLVMSEPQQPIPTDAASAATKEAFARACYHSVKASVVPCSGCNEVFRIHDLPEHQLVCGSRRHSRSKIG